MQNEQIEGVDIQLVTRESILDNLNIAIYVTDLESNEILYANRVLREIYEGRILTGGICWEALQNRTERCGFCPIPYLLKHPGEFYHREKYNGSHLKIIDSIILWANGRMAHLQYTMDITREYP